MYTTIVAGMASFAAAPDLALPQSRAAEMTAYATTLADRLDTLATTMQAELDELTITLSAPTGLTDDDLVTLDWSDNTETDLVGYGVYRTTTSGGPYELRAWALTVSYYSDPSVVSGTTYYYYVVTAINESSMESEYSNEAAASPVGGA
jgi:fibronectin type 3 domain-containing protein